MHPYAGEVNRMLAEYRRRRAEFDDLRVRMHKVTVTVRAPSQVVSVTVGHQGEVTSLDFPTGAYRQMAPAELATVLLSTIEAARAKALVQVAELMAPQSDQSWVEHDRLTLTV